MKILYFSLIFFVFSALGFATSPGDNAPAIGVNKWISGTSITLPSPGLGQDKSATSEREFFAVVIWATSAPDALYSMNILKNMQKKYPRLRVLVITRDSEHDVTSFLSSNHLMDMNVALDKNNSTTRSYMQNSIILPRIFLVDDCRKVIWSGDVMDFPEVFDQVRNDKFDLEQAKKIDAISKQLVTALQSTDFHGVIRHSERMLELDPTNSFAIRARLFEYETNNATDDAIKFIKKLISRKPDVSRLYFIQLELMLRANKTAGELQQVYAQMLKIFSYDPQVMLNFSWIMLDKVPFNLRDPLILRQACTLAFEQMPQDASPVEKAGFKTAMARVHTLWGEFARALELQREAVVLLKDDARLENEARRTLKIIEQLSNSSSKNTAE
ncbi:MAG: hypothetical protein JXR78_11575 [Victivallales bacterium]|nr:hypothetical protein [Victivallales bacterium]